MQERSGGQSARSKSSHPDLAGCSDPVQSGISWDRTTVNPGERWRLRLSAATSITSRIRGTRRPVAKASARVALIAPIPQRSWEGRFEDHGGRRGQSLPTVRARLESPHA